ncbi:hypothetical protein Poli38472_005739 [Pythium oligandrum]|uniref:Uncharacterized protein n=1 Tax=Pythium oligandrum TaxID=41045 RepID=A0A8K1CR33_PYTOL|nr:hypothetical protein Poli38472_005739 [Pythium oligandrum]|eukprot:TMW68271.1 hypothetical protein Poli38472_005739 [Pythium oligandrum]
MESLSIKQVLLSQSDKVRGVTLTCATGVVTVCGALLVYSNRLKFMWEPRSMVVALGLATGGVLSFTLMDLLPAAQVSLEVMIKAIDPVAQTRNATASSAHEKRSLQSAYASMILAGAFALGVIMVWIMDTLSMYCSLPTKVIQQSPREQTRATIRHTTRTTSPSPLQTSNVLMTQNQGWLSKELLYKTGVAKVASFATINLPSGLVMCIAVVQRRTLGILFACAMSLLNVAQGIALSGVIVQASGMRWRAVLWCVLAALALPLGGFLAWGLLLNTRLNALVVGVMYSITAGLLVGTSLTQILTVCYNYKSSENSVVTTSIFGGIIFIAVVRCCLAFLYNK